MRFLAFLLLSASICSAQNKQRIIVVQGNARASVKPDIARISFTIEYKDTSQVKAMAQVNRQVDRLTKLLANQGIATQLIKISDYRIDDEQDYIQTKRGIEEHIPQYRVYNTLIATLDLDGKRINEILKGIELQRINGVEVSFDFELSDSLEKAARAQLTQQALLDAKANAEVMSSSLKVQLKGVVQASKNGVSMLRLNEPTDVLKVLAPPLIEAAKGIVFASAFEKFDVTDKELFEEVVVVYEISQ